MAATKTVEIGALELFGTTNQSTSSEALIGVTMYPRVATGGSYAGRTPINSGTAVLNIQSMDVAQFADRQLSKDGAGLTGNVTVSDDGISCRLNVIPQGTTLDGTAATGALAAASVPAIGSYCTITNAPIMAFGAFTTASNSNRGAFNSTNWQVVNASLRFAAGARAVIDLELVQYISPAMRPVAD